MTIEHLYGGVMGVETALGSLDRLLTDLARVELDTLDRGELGRFAIRLGRGIDKAKYFHAKVVLEADRAQSWQESGARDAAEWLSNQTGTSRGEANSRLRLGEALETSPELSDAVDNNEITASAAEQLHDAIVNPPDGTDAQPHPVDHVEHHQRCNQPGRTAHPRPHTDRPFTAPT